MPGNAIDLRRGEGFQTPGTLAVHLISNQAHSITLTPLRDYKTKQKIPLNAGNLFLAES